jgi:DNA-directed RNA polymerase subunit E"
MAKEKACKQCKFIYEGTSCPKCSGTDTVDGFKGKIAVADSTQSEIAQKLGVKEKGVYAMRLR